MRIPYMWEAWTGQNMNYYYAQNVPLSLMTKEPRKYVKENDIEAIKGMIFRGLWEIDDP